jgi:hypothetical protein
MIAEMMPLTRPAVRWHGPMTCTAPPIGSDTRSPGVCGGPVGEDWRCQTCGSLAEYATYPGTCDLCGRRCSIIRHRHEARANCHCHIPPALRAQLDAEEAARRDKLDKKREWALARRMQDAEIAQHRSEAAECLASRDGYCTEARPPKHPFPACTSCRVNTERSTR